MLDSSWRLPNEIRIFNTFSMH